MGGAFSACFRSRARFSGPSCFVAGRSMPRSAKERHSTPSKPSRWAMSFRWRRCPGAALGPFEVVQAQSVAASRQDGLGRRTGGMLARRASARARGQFGRFQPIDGQDVHVGIVGLVAVEGAHRQGVGTGRGQVSADPAQSLSARVQGPVVGQGDDEPAGDDAALFAALLRAPPGWPPPVPP